MSSLCTKCCSEVTQPRSAVLIGAPAQDWTNDEPSNHSWIDEEKAVEPVNLYSTQGGAHLGSDRCRPQCFPWGVWWLTEDLEAGSCGRKFTQSPDFQGCTHYLPCFLTTCSSPSCTCMSAGSMQPATNYISQKTEISIFFPTSNESSRPHYFFPEHPYIPAFF